MKLLSLFLMIASLMSAWEKPPHMGEAQWEYTVPYLLPEDHPAKSALNKIFSEGRPTASEKALHKAGFSKISVNPKTGVGVYKHKELKGYAVKLYTDDWTGICDWCMWVKRAKGAQVIRECIDKHGLQHVFTVPKKWVYPLPIETYDPSAPEPKDFIMLVEDMKPVDEVHNTLLWRSKLVNPPVLNAFWTILTEAGLLDSVYTDNVPFNAEGKIVFIDTEHFHEWPIPYHKIPVFLNKQMAGYWHGLINRGGP